MKGNFLPSFWRSFERLSLDEQKRIQDSIPSFLDHFQKGNLPQGLGMKKLRKSIWEIRVGLSLRILFEIRKGGFNFFFVGNHDQVQRFLKS